MDSNELNRYVTSSRAEGIRNSTAAQTQTMDNIAYGAQRSRADWNRLSPALEHWPEGLIGNGLVEAGVDVGADRAIGLSEELNEMSTDMLLHYPFIIRNRSCKYTLRSEGHYELHSFRAYNHIAKFCIPSLDMAQESLNCCLVHKFEHALIDLQGQYCAWGVCFHQIDAETRRNAEIDNVVLLFTKEMYTIGRDGQVPAIYSRFKHAWAATERLGSKLHSSVSRQNHELIADLLNSVYVQLLNLAYFMRCIPKDLADYRARENEGNLADFVHVDGENSERSYDEYVRWARTTSEVAMALRHHTILDSDESVTDFLESIMREGGYDSV